MSSEISLNYPEKIWVKMVENFEKDLKKVGESDRDFYESLLNPGHTLKAEIPALNKFITGGKKSQRKLSYLYPTQKGTDMKTDIAECWGNLYKRYSKDFRRKKGIKLTYTINKASELLEKDLN